jgi:hypothetical protein
MQRIIVVGTLAACVLLPAVANAQPGPGDMGPPPAVRAKLDAVNAQAKAAGFAALSADHRARVQAIVARVSAGTLDPRSAAAQIDALLTPDEAKAVLGVATASRAQMRAAFGDAPPPPPPGGPNGAGGPGGPGDAPPPSDGAPPQPPAAHDGPPPGPPGREHRPQTPGSFLMRVSITPEQMRALRDANRPPAP